MAIAHEENEPAEAGFVEALHAAFDDLGLTAEEAKIDHKALFALIDQIINSANERPTFGVDNSELLLAGKTMLEAAKQSFQLIKDISHIEAIYLSLLATQLCTVHIERSPNEFYVAEARRLASLVMRSDDPKIRDAKLRAELIVSHYRNNPPRGMSGDAPLDTLIPSAGRMLRDGRLRRALREQLPKQNIEDPETGEWSGISERSMKRTRAEILGKEKPSRSKEALSKKRKLVKAAGTR
jgi:hypothetical protein